MTSRTKCHNQHSVLQLFQTLSVGFLTLNLIACGGGGGGSEPTTQRSESATAGLSDIAIAKTVYNDTRTPKGFYTEKFRDDAYYSVSHVKNIDLVPIANRTGMAIYELSSNDFTEALGWSELAASNQLDNKQLVDNSESFMYLEFVRVDPASPQFIQLNRVFKADVLDRAGVDQTNPDRYQGRVTMPTINVSQVKTLIEYLWGFTSSNNYGHAVLTSYTSESDDQFSHTMLQADLNINYHGGCDIIEVYEHHYTVSKDSGFIWMDKSLQRLIKARRNGSQIEVCEP